MSVAARPAEKATMSASPRLELVLGDRAEQHDEGGRARDDPGRCAEHEESAAADGGVPVAVVVVVVMVVRVAAAPGAARARAARRAPTATTSDPGREVSHG